MDECERARLKKILPGALQAAITKVACKNVTYNTARIWLSFEILIDDSDVMNIKLCQSLKSNVRTVAESPTPPDPQCVKINCSTLAKESCNDSDKKTSSISDEMPMTPISTMAKVFSTPSRPSSVSSTPCPSLAKTVTVPRRSSSVDSFLPGQRGIAPEENFKKEVLSEPPAKKPRLKKENGVERIGDCDSLDDFTPIIASSHSLADIQQPLGSITNYEEQINDVIELNESDDDLEVIEEHGLPQKRSHANGFITCTKCNRQLPSAREFSLHMLIAHSVSTPNFGVNSPQQHQQQHPHHHQQQQQQQVHQMQFQHQQQLYQQQMQEIQQRRMAQQRLQQQQMMQMQQNEQFGQAGETSHDAQQNIQKAAEMFAPGPFPCRTCSNVFERLEDLNEHKVQEHGAARCPTCHKVYNSAYLATHMLTHDVGERRFVCNTCGQSLSSKQSLKLHIQNRHSNIKMTYHCEICKKGFTTNHYMQEHKRKIHGIGAEVFNCGHCSKSFSAKQQLINHCPCPVMLKKEEKKESA